MNTLSQNTIPSHMLGYVTSIERQSNWLIVDVETTGRAGIEHLLETPEAAGNLKDPEKIAADIAKKVIERDSKLALDSCLNRIVAISVYAPKMDGLPITYIPRNEDEERVALSLVWNLVQPDYSFPRRTIMGFHARSFDVPVMLQRTRLLGMAEPAIDYGRYSKSIVDLAEILAFGDPRWEPGSQLMRRKLKNYCSLFQIPQCEDDCDGSDIPNLIAAGELERVRQHCQADVLRTYNLARRLNVLA